MIQATVDVSGAVTDAGCHMLQFLLGVCFGLIIAYAPSAVFAAAILLLAICVGAGLLIWLIAWMGDVADRNYRGR